METGPLICSGFNMIETTVMKVLLNKLKLKNALSSCTYQGVRNVCFSEILACFAFLKHLFCDSPFSLITDVITCIVTIGHQKKCTKLNKVILHINAKSITNLLMLAFILAKLTIDLYLII